MSTSHTALQVGCLEFPALAFQHGTARWLQGDAFGFNFGNPLNVESQKSKGGGRNFGALMGGWWRARPNSRPSRSTTSWHLKVVRQVNRFGQVHPDLPGHDIMEALIMAVTPGLVPKHKFSTTTKKVELYAIKLFFGIPIMVKCLSGLQFLALASLAVCASAGVLLVTEEPPQPPLPYSFSYAAGRAPGHVDRVHSEISDGTGVVRGLAHLLIKVTGFVIEGGVCCIISQSRQFIL